MRRAWARRQGQSVIFARDLRNTVWRRDLDDAVAKLSTETGLAHHPPGDGEYAAGTYPKRVTPASGRFAMDDDGLAFQLVAALTQKLGQHMLGMMTVERGPREAVVKHRFVSSARDLQSPETFEHLNLVGRSPLFVEAFRRIERMAEVDAGVLILGETGTGKELAARALHYLSRRNGFIPVNCGALPDNLLESELFGHEQGVFTDAKRANRPGRSAGCR